MVTDRYVIKLVDNTIGIKDTSLNIVYYSPIENWNLAINIVTYLLPKQNKGILFLTKHLNLQERYAKMLYQAAVQFVKYRDRMQEKTIFGDSNGKV